MRVLVQRYAGDLAGRPVWLLSSGPIGDRPSPGTRWAGETAGALQGGGGDDRQG